MFGSVKKAVLAGAVFWCIAFIPIADSSNRLIGAEKKNVAKKLEVHQTSGVVITTTYFSVKLKSEEDGLVTFYIRENDKLGKDEVGQLKKGDKVTILWKHKDGRNWVQDVVGDGVRGGSHLTKGVVVITTYFSVKLKSEEDGLVTYYIQEKDLLTRQSVGLLGKGDKVTLLWSREDGHNWVRDLSKE